MRYMYMMECVAEFQRATSGKARADAAVRLAETYLVMCSHTIADMAHECARSTIGQGLAAATEYKIGNTIRDLEDRLGRPPTDDEVAMLRDLISSEVRALRGAR